MYRPVACYPEILGKACILKHGGGIAADKHGLSAQKPVVIIQIKKMGLLCKFPVIDSHLAVVFADIFKITQLEGANRHGKETHHADFFLNAVIIEVTRLLATIR
jgi:hypothetical protein